MKKPKISTLGFYVLIFIALLIPAYLFTSKGAAEEVKYSDIINKFEAKEVSSFKIKDSTLEYTLKDDKDGKTYKYNLYSVGLFLEDVQETVAEQRKEGTLSYDLIPPVTIPWWVSIVVPFVLVILVFVVLGIFMTNQMNGGGKAMSFGKARIKTVNDTKNKITFKDVAGADEEKEELEEIVDFLKNPKKYIELGARIPKGVLLVGSPGTGKTLLAKAVAGEAGVPFYSISGSDFVELYVGVGASRVRDLFDQAKKSAPSIVFIDEIDAVGRQRGAGLGGGHDEREQTLNQLLVEMDGFGVNEGVIVIAATNRADILDNALLRPGRFDRQIVVAIPDLKGRKAILDVHSKNKKFAQDVNLETIARGTTGFTGADLENILNEAALLAARRKKETIDMQDIEDSIRRVTIGVEKKSRVVSKKDKINTAYHEAGHAIVSKFLKTQDPVHEISIIPRGMSGGYTLYLPHEDKAYMSKNEMLESIISLLGGRAAETIALDDISTGASNDIERATSISRQMVTKFGMSDLGTIAFGSDHDEVFLGRDFTSKTSYSEATASKIDGQIEKIINTSYQKAIDILNENINILHELSQMLVEKEKITGVEFYALFGEEMPKREESVFNRSTNNEIQ